jgi:alkylation response protein AidB-like acyl-CoA dehydrogenase
VDLELSYEEAALRDNVRSVLEGVCPLSVPRAVYDGRGRDPNVWVKMVELGWPALAIDPSHGGLGLGAVELTLLSEELGRAVVPSPLFATVTQFAPAVFELGGPSGAARFQPSVASGEITGTVAIAERGVWAPEAVRASVRRADGGWALFGEKCAVVDGATADEVVVVARGEDGLGAFVVPGPTVDVLERTVVDPTMPVADLVLDGVVVGPDRVLAAPGDRGVEQAVDRLLQGATVALAAMTVGACRRIFETTVDYAKAREQYGRPIGSFQALKHRLVEMYLTVERATALVYYAALTIAEESPDRALASSAAKAAAGDCQRLVAEDGLQLHGGVGFTWEHDLHLLLKRAKTGDALFGGAVAHRASLAALLGVAA